MPHTQWWIGIRKPNVTSMQIELHAMREDYLQSSRHLGMKSSEFFHH